MADRVAIVLEYLRRHHFAKAEAALQAELLARQGMDGSLFSASRNDLDLNFSLLADSGMEEGSTCHEKFLQEPWGRNFSASCNSVQQGSDPSSGEQVVEVKVLETASTIGFKKVKIQQFLPEERIPWGLQSDEREPQQGKFEYEEMLDTGDGSLSIQSGVAGCNGMENVCWQPGHNFKTDTDSKLERSKGKFLSKIEDSERVFLSGSVECQRMKSCKQGELQGGTKSWKAHYENKDGTSGKGLIAQNEKEEICESWQTNMWFHDIKSQHGRVEAQLKKTSSLKEPYQVVEFLNEADAEQDANQGFCKVYAKEAREVDKSEELCGLSLCEAGYDSAQPDIGAPQLEKATIMHESGEYSEKELYKLEERAPMVVGSSLLTQLESDAADSYSVLMENGWLDQEPLKNGLPRQFDSGALFKTGYPYFLCSSDQQSAIRIQPQEEKQVDLARDSQNVKLQGKEVEMQHTDRLNDSTLPWEVNFSSKRDGLSCFEDSKSTSEKADGELPRLPHVKLRSMDRNLNPFRETDGNVNFGSALDLHLGSTNTTLEPSFELGLYLDIPLGQDINSSGSNRLTGSSRPSVSQGIVEDSPALLSGFAMLGDGPGDSGIGYPHEYWDSDGYEDDDDLGYHRQPIEDEAWFLAHEIDYPSDDERAKLSMAGTGSQPGKKHEKLEDEDHSFMEEESYFSGEQFYRPDQNESRAALSDTEGMNRTEFCGGTGESNLVSLNQIESLKYDSQLMDAEELKLMRAEPAWQGFVSQSNKLDLLSREKVVKDVSRCHEKDYFPVDDDRQGSVRSGGAGVSSDMADFGSEVRESFPEGSSEGDVESEQDPRGYGAAHINLGQCHTTSNVRTVVQDAVRHCGQGVNEHDKTVRYRIEDWGHKSYSSGRQLAQSSSYGLTQSVDGQSHNHYESVDGGGFGFGGFSFPSPSSTGDMAGSKADSGKSLWSRRENTTAGDNIDAIGNSITGPDDTLASWKRKSNESSPIRSPRDATFLNLPSSTHSTVSPHSTDGSLSRGAKEVRDEAIESCDRENGKATAVDDEETAAIQEQFRQIKAGEDEYEVFNLRIIHRRNRTGFEEEKNFPVVINSVIAGRYHVTEYLGSAAFSKAIQAHDLQTGLDVCMKIIKNNKDFFDQSLDEIKLLKYINRHDPYDKFHILRLYDYFYFREHLFIVCELLRANLYEFHKFNRESGGEVYFTMPRLQSITRQCLEALEFLHNLGLIHCDLKPENILVKSYSRCEVKVIDLGSSCFQTDHLCPYVQSRSYRAPEVILGHPYNQKIDIWSLGCILAELCSGNVLFQNDSLATLLARVIGIIAPIDPEMLAKGHDTHKFFTKNYMLYERNQDTNQLEYLVPKKTSLRHRLPMGDQGFVDFVGYLLQINPDNRPSATEALKHPWLSYPYEPISS